MARCVIDAPHKAFVGHTVVRMWWPGRCYWVSTLRYRWINGLDAFATQIYKCNAAGIQYVDAPPLYEQHYNDLTHARVGTCRLSFGPWI